MLQIAKNYQITIVCEFNECLSAIQSPKIQINHPNYINAGRIFEEGYKHSTV